VQKSCISGAPTRGRPHCRAERPGCTLEARSLPVLALQPQFQAPARAIRRLPLFLEETRVTVSALAGQIQGLGTALASWVSWPVAAPLSVAAAAQRQVEKSP